MKVTIRQTESGIYVIKDPETGAEYTGKDKERVKQIFLNRHVQFEDEDISPEETVKSILAFMKRGMKIGDIIDRMSVYGTTSYEPNTFEGVSNRDFIETMHRACIDGLPEVVAPEHRVFLQDLPTDLFEVVSNTDLVIPKSFNVIANVPFTNWGNRAYWILKDDTPNYTLIAARKDGSGWGYFERSSDSTDKLLEKFVTTNECGVHIRYNLELQLKKLVAIGVYRMKETTS